MLPLNLPNAEVHDFGSGRIMARGVVVDIGLAIIIGNIGLEGLQRTEGFDNRFQGLYRQC